MGKPLEAFNFEWTSQVTAGDIMLFGAVPVIIIIALFGFIATSRLFARRDWDRLSRRL